MKHWMKRLVWCVVLAAALVHTVALAAPPVVPAETAPGVEAPTEPAPTQPEPTVPATEPEPTEPGVTEPPSTDPAEPTEPEPTEPEPTEPEPTEPEPTEPEPTEPEPTEPEPTEPDPLEGYTFPETWAKAPLQFAVRYGILEGRGNYNLDPLGYTSRVEMAAMMVRLLAATGEGDLSAFQDVNPNAWYYRELGTAVSLGIFQGVSDTRMNPNRSITREEAFTVLARTFGLTAEDPEAYTRFTDAGKISGYARQAVSALYEAGCIRGYEDGSVHPRATITRQEVAALFYQLLDAICDEAGQLPEAGYVLYRGEEQIPDGYTLDGTLVLAMTGGVNMHQVTVSDQLVLRCQTGTAASMDEVNAGTLAVVSTMTASGGEFVLTAVYGKDSTVDVEAEQVQVYAPCTVSGSAKTVLSYTPGLKLNASTGELQLTGEAGGGATRVEGKVGHVAVDGDEITLTGGGYAQTITVRGRNCTVTLDHGKLVEEIDWGLYGVQAKLTGPATITPQANTATVKATFTGFRAGIGTDGDGRTCTLEWYLDGKLLSSQPDFWMTDGATATYSHVFAGDTPPETDPVFTVVATCGEDRVEASFTVAVDREVWEEAEALNIVQTVNIEGETLRDTYLYGDRNRDSILRTVPEGTTVIHLYNPEAADNLCQVRMADGTVGWMDWSDYLVSRENYTQSWDYSETVKTAFVNQRGYSSPTGYLIWLNLKTQKVNIFQGSQGNWELIRVSPCASGKNTTPTVSGVFSIIYKTDYWRYSGYEDGEYVHDHHRVYNISGFRGGQAFHSRLYYTEGGGLYDDTMGTPASAGCVRMMDEDCLFIYNSIPYNTTVVVY